jgi:hypothetical protein
MFFGYDDFVDWQTTRKTSVIPSFFIPAWQDNAADELAYLTRMTFLGQYQAPGSAWDYFYFSSWKTFGENPNGDWTLSITDTVSGITGTLRSWLLQISYTSPPTAAPVDPPANPPNDSPVASPASSAPSGGSNSPSASAPTPTSGASVPTVTSSPATAKAPSSTNVNASAVVIPAATFILLALVASVLSL